jgi:hypothetical protein
MNGKGFDARTWPDLATFAGRCATAHDVDDGAAVFALGDTFNGRTMPMVLPQPVIWWDEDDEKGAVAVQAEAHETEDGELMEVLGWCCRTGARPWPCTRTWTRWTPPTRSGPRW